MASTNWPFGVSPSNRDAANQINPTIKYRVIRIRFDDGTGENDTGFNLPSNAIVIPQLLMVNVVTAEASGGTKTIDLGILSTESGGNADGFIDGLSVATTGLKIPDAAVTVGGSETYYSANTLGVMLSDYIVGTNTGSDFGLFHPKNFSTGSITGKSVSWTPGSADFAELVADVAIGYIELA